MQRTGPLLAQAIDDVEAARRALAHAQQVAWVSASADLYRAVLADAAVAAGAARAGVEAAVLPVAALDLAVVRGPAVGTAVGTAFGTATGTWAW